MRIFTNTTIPQSLLGDFDHHDLLQDAADLPTADVAFGQPDPEVVATAASLRWVAISSAGFNRYERDDVRASVAGRGLILTNASGVFDEPCAQHALALLLADRRALPTAAAAQRDRRWDAKAVRPASRLLDAGTTVALFGFGAIARRLTELLRPFGVRVVGVRRSPTGDEPCDTIASSDAPALAKLLGESDVLVNILPAGPGRDGFFDAARFRQAKRGATYISIGRGSTTVSADLRAALEAGQLSAAWLDVTDPEPLPPGDPLWTAANCHITPHTAGGMSDEATALARHFLDNLRRFERGEPLRDRVIL